jgi:hypothetical protein
MDDHRSVRPGQQASPGYQGTTAPAATVGLMTAAHVLGISRSDARTLAQRGEFPCSVVWVGEDYRVPFTALLRLLRSLPSHATERSPGPCPPGGEER